MGRAGDLISLSYSIFTCILNQSNLFVASMNLDTCNIRKSLSVKSHAVKGGGVGRGQNGCSTGSARRRRDGSQKKFGDWVPNCPQLIMEYFPTVTDGFCLICKNNL